MNISRLTPLAVATAASLLWLMGPAPRAQQTASAPTAAAAAPDASLELDLEHEDRLKGLKKVAIAGLALYVITEDSGGITSGTAFHGSMGNVSSSVKVVGLEPARLQALADEALDETVRTLQARGIEVMPQATLQALPGYAELKEAANAAPMELDSRGGKGTVYSARGLPLIHRGEGAWLNRMVGGLFGAKVSDPYVTVGEGIAAGFRKGQLDPAMQTLGESAKVPLLWVRLVLSAAQLKTSGGAFDLSAKTEIRNTLVLTPWTTRILVRQPDGDMGRVSLKKALPSQTSPGELVDVTTTGTKAANLLTTAFTTLAALSGHGRAVNSSSLDAELRTTPEQFDGAARPQIATALASLAQALQP